MSHAVRGEAGVHLASPPVAGPAGRAERMALIGSRVALFFLFFFAYTLFAPRFMRYLDPLTGDEPYYVMTALSIMRDGDLNEAQNYAQRDYLSFYPPEPLPQNWVGWPAFPRTLPPHPANTVQPGLYSKHGLGVVLLILLPYALAGRAGVVVLLNACAALVALNVYLLSRRYIGRGGLALGLAAMLAFSNPLMSYAYLIFPEMFAALGIVYAFRRGREPRGNGWQWLLVGGLLGLLPWLHARFIPAVLGLGLGLLPALAREPRWSRRAALVVPPVLSAAALVRYYFYIYGQPLPSTADHAGFSDFWGTVNGFFGLFLDEQWGLLIYTPLYVLSFLTLLRFVRDRRSDAAAALAVVAPYLGLVALYRVWWGEWGPPARYVAPVVPLLALPVAWWLSRVSSRVAATMLLTLGIPGLVIMGAFVVAPQLMYNQPDGHSALFTAVAAQLGREWPKVIPSFQFYALSSPVRRTVWSLALLALVVIPALWPARRATRHWEDAAADRGAV